MVRSIGKGRDAYFAHPEGNYWKIVWSEGSNPVVAAARRAAGQPTQVQAAFAVIVTSQVRG
jgi:hypothetical protein